MGDCDEYSTSSRGGKTSGVECYPIITKNEGYTFRIQDNYNLEEDDKWDIVYDVLMNKIDSRNDKKIEDKANFKIYDKKFNEIFYNKENEMVLTLDFLNYGKI